MNVDVLVLGAGPAGSATAIDLARRGFRVAIADRKSFPRAKPCGEFLSPECQPYLAELGEGDLLARLGAWRVDGMRLSADAAVAHGAFRDVVGKPHACAGFGIRRERFDLALVEAAGRAGAEFLPRHEFVRLARDAAGAVVGAVLRDPDGVERAIACSHVVGADGVHSRVARELGVQRPVPWLQQFALTTHFRGVAPRARASAHLFPRGFFAATTVDDGCFSVNIVLPKSELRAHASHDHDALLRQKLADAPDLLALIDAAQRTTPWRGIGPFAHEVAAATGNGWLLVGDAAGYCDPLTGEGIYFALFGARHAATALAAALDRPAAADASMRAYEAARQREIGPRLRASRWLQRGLQHPWILRTAVRSLARWPTLADLVVTMSGDTIHPRDLLRPIVLARVPRFGMTRTLLDLRVWLPPVLGALAFAPRALPTAAETTATTARASELPALATPRRDEKPRTWRLAAEGSTVRFLVQDGPARLLVACPTVDGTLTRDPAGAGTLELKIDLATATTLAGTDGLDLHRVLGVRRADVISYRGAMVSTATTDLPGVERALFVGRLAFGDRVLQQPMQLWLTRIPGRPARLQGHGPVRTDAYMLPRRRWLGIDPSPLQATLGLDLEWRLDAR